VVSLSAFLSEAGNKKEVRTRRGVIGNESARVERTNYAVPSLRWQSGPGKAEKYASHTINTNRGTPDAPCEASSETSGGKVCRQTRG